MFPTHVPIATVGQDINSLLTDLDQELNEVLTSFTHEMALITTDFHRNLLQQQTQSIVEERGQKRKALSTHSSGSESKRKKPEPFSEEQKVTLLKWIHNHLDNPYPTDVEKQELVKQTGLSRKQLDNWFVNYRKRYLKNQIPNSVIPPLIRQKNAFNDLLEQKFNNKEFQANPVGQTSPSYQ